MKKKLLSLAQALAMCLSLTVPVLAESSADEKSFIITCDGKDVFADSFLTGGDIVLSFGGDAYEGKHATISENSYFSVTCTDESKKILIGLVSFKLMDDGTYLYDSHGEWRRNENENECRFVDSVSLADSGGWSVFTLNKGESLSFTGADLCVFEGAYYLLSVSAVSSDITNFTEADEVLYTYSVALKIEDEVTVEPEEPSTPDESDTTATPAITATGTQDGIIVVTLTNATFDAVEGAKISNWFVGTNLSYRISDVKLNSDRTEATLTLAYPISLTWAEVAVNKTAIADFDDNLSCMAAITSGDSNDTTDSDNVATTPPVVAPDIFPDNFFVPPLPAFPIQSQTRPPARQLPRSCPRHGNQSGRQHNDDQTGWNRYDDGRRRDGQQN